MRCSSACRGFLAAATVIGATFFSLSASAATFTPLPPTYDPSTGLVTLGVRITGQDASYFTRVLFFEYGNHLGTPAGGGPVGIDANGEAVVTLAHYPFGFHNITAVAHGGPPDYPQGATFTYDVEPPLNWLPAVLDRLLSD